MRANGAPPNSHSMPYRAPNMTRVPSAGHRREQLGPQHYANPPIRANHPPQSRDMGYDKDIFFKLVTSLMDPEHREAALLALSKKREVYPDLACVLWHSVGTMACLLNEIITVYPLLATPEILSPGLSNRCCNALALMQCVASHSQTKKLFLNAHIPLFLYPFLNTTHSDRPFEYLRLTSLGVLGALVKQDDPEVIKFLLQTEIIPLCLRIMENGTELSKTVATFILQKILLDDEGLAYICATAERFYTVNNVLENMVKNLSKNPSSRLLKHIIRCYFRLSENTKAREALRQCIPQALWKESHSLVNEDPAVNEWTQGLAKNLGVSPIPTSEN